MCFSIMMESSKRPAFKVNKKIRKSTYEQTSSNIMHLLWIIHQISAAYGFQCIVSGKSCNNYFNEATH